MSDNNPPVAFTENPRNTNPNPSAIETSTTTSPATSTSSASPASSPPSQNPVADHVQQPRNPCDNDAAIAAALQQREENGGRELPRLPEENREPLLRDTGPVAKHEAVSPPNAPDTINCGGTAKLEAGYHLPAKRNYEYGDEPPSASPPKRPTAVAASFPYKPALPDRAIIICKTCQTRVKDKKEFLSHKCPNKVIAYICQRCTSEAIFSTTQSYAAHIKNTHHLRQHTTSAQPLTTNTTSIITHPNPLPIPTPVSPYPTQNTPSHAPRNTHTLAVDMTKWTTAQFPCSVCNEVFQDHISIEAHKREHNHICDTKWQCRHCGVRYDVQHAHAAHIGQLKKEIGKNRLNDQDTERVIGLIEEKLQKISVQLLPSLELIDIKPNVPHPQKSSGGTTNSLADPHSSSPDPHPTAPELPPYQVFPSQEREARKLFEIIKGEWNELPNSYRSLDVLILVQLQLFDQTLNRVRSFEEHITNSEQFHGMRRNLRIRVVKGNNYKDRKHDTREFFDKAERCKDDPEHFFVIIHDECHWGTKYTKKEKPGRLGSILKDALVRPGNNMLILQISTTAWNQIELLKRSFGSEKIEEREKIGKLEKHVHVWTETGPDDGMEYIGRQKLMDSKCITESNSFCLEKCEELCNELFPDDPFLFNKLAASSDWPTFLSLMTYIAAFIKRHCEEYSEVVPSERWIQIVDCPHTLEAVKLIKQGHIVAVRLPSNLSRCYGKIISRLLKGLGETRFFCVHDAIDSDHDGSKTLVTEECAVRLAALQGRRKATFRNYQDLNGLPCLLVLVEKARMGDTMPINFKLFDLRARYLTPKFVFSAFLQDIGRAFEWCQAEKPGKPTQDCIRVYVNSMAYQYAKNPVETLQCSNGQLEPCLKKTGGKKCPYERVPDNAFPASLEVFLNPNLIWKPSEMGSWKFLEENLSDLSDKLKQRFVISAEPQIGKTGAYLHFIELLVNHFELPPANHEEEMFYYVLGSLTNMDPNELHSKLERGDPETLQNWRFLLQCQDKLFEATSERERLLLIPPEDQTVPSSRAASFIWDLCFKHGLPQESLLDGSPVCLVADMGCGTCALAKKLKEYHPQIQVTNFDHTYGEEDSCYKVVPCNFTNTPAQEGVFDVVVFSMSLSWGGARPEFVHKAIVEAKRILKPKGYIFVADELNNWCWLGGVDPVPRALMVEFANQAISRIGNDGSLFIKERSIDRKYFYLAMHT